MFVRANYSEAPHSKEDGGRGLARAHFILDVQRPFPVCEIFFRCLGWAVALFREFSKSTEKGFFLCIWLRETRLV
jgi:hypothetical protein